MIGDEKDIELFLNELPQVEDDEFQFYSKKKKILRFKIWSKNIPNLKWLEDSIKKYPSLWIENKWHDELGLQGVWVGSSEEIKHFEWVIDGRFLQPIEI
jgi:hypothetical protein